MPAKSMTTFVLIISGAILFNALPAFADGDAVLGEWLTLDGKARVHIEKADGKYSGSICWLKEPEYPDGDPEQGKPKHDRENPDKAKKQRPLMGLRLIEGFEFDGKNTWTKGSIYDPESGNTYKCKMTLDGDKLHVRGFIGISLIGRTTTWSRHKPDNEKTDQSQ